MIRVGLISDTHGLLRPQALEALAGSDLIIHAGDIGGSEASAQGSVDNNILRELANIAPTTAVRGNNDVRVWSSLPETALVAAGEAGIYVIHDIAELPPAAIAHGVHVVVSGHSHQPCFAWKDDVLFINPGSAGPRRFSLPVSVASLLIEGTRIDPQLRELHV